MEWFMDDENDFKLALFRYGLISPLLHMGGGEGLSRQIKEIAKKEYDIPSTRKRKLSVKSIWRYYRQYKAYGFTGLKRVLRSDRNKSKALTDELIEFILALKREEFCRSTRKIIYLVRQDPAYQ